MNSLSKTQENKLTMYEGVITLLENNTEIVSPIGAFVTTREDFKAAVEQIRAKGQEKREATRGKTQTKHDAEDVLVNALLEIASPLYSFARRAKMNEVMEICDVTEYKLRRLRDTELESIANSIQARSAANAAGLTAYGITEAMITGLAEKIAAYHNALGERESGVATRVGVTKTLAELFKQADELLYDDMDRIVERLRTSNAEFYTMYLGARVVKDLGIRHEEQPTPPPSTPTPPTP